MLKPKVEKDPGIPNDWPFKEQELKALEARRQRAIQELEEKKAARKEKAQKRKLGLLEDEEVDEQSSAGDKQIIGNSTGTTQNGMVMNSGPDKHLVLLLNKIGMLVHQTPPIRTINYHAVVYNVLAKTKVGFSNSNLVPREAVERNGSSILGRNYQ
ncbi:UNVERIFIED_CONTAM: Guanine nucleotide-binding protein-like NSN1 [Sesamum radiatum]|uniref:Guanine nucleotide-binding protein-like NSN1 n=1 Tax=Sesamum radiatum TaxID=300843 RepID=A0AAW2W7M5_SESRA